MKGIAPFDVYRPTPHGLSVGMTERNQFSGYGYDAAGNMTMDSWHTSVYDAENRLVSIDSNATTFTYDANGMRVRKTTGSNWTEYLYFGGNVIAEKDQTGTWTDYIFAGGKRVAKAVGASTSTMQYYHSDHLGSSTMVTDASGNVVSQSTYVPYGCEFNPTSGGCGQSSANHYKFTGKERDSESDLDYFGARYYSNRMGRWTSPDWSDAPSSVPFANLSAPQSLNLYAYVSNSPIVSIDLDGHQQIMDPPPAPPPPKPAPKPSPGSPTKQTARQTMPGAKSNGSAGTLGAAAAVVAAADLTISRTTDAYVANKEDQIKLDAIESQVASENAAKLKGQQHEDEVLYRYGSSPESASRLERKSEEAAAVGLPHGVSVNVEPQPASRSASRSAVQQVFPVVNTGPPGHRTVVMPHPVTPADAKAFNNLFRPTL